MEAHVRRGSVGTAYLCPAEQDVVESKSDAFAGRNINRCKGGDEMPNHNRLSTFKYSIVLACTVLANCSGLDRAPQNIEKQLMIAEELITLGEVDRAYRILDKLSIDPDTTTSTQVEIGNHFLKMNALVRAKSAYFKVAELGNEIDANIGFGKLALKENDAKRAAAYFNRVLEQEPDNGEALNGIGVSLDLQGDHASARDYYNQVLEIYPVDINALNNLSLSYILSGSANIGVNTLQDLSESQLANQTVLLNLAIGLSLMGDRINANELAKQIMSEEDAEKVFKSVQRYVIRNS